jgi:hypothetical protein
MACKVLQKLEAILCCKEDKGLGGKFVIFSDIFLLIPS